MRIEGAVVLGVQGSQSRHHGERGIARYLTAQALAVAELDPGAIESFDLDSGLPQPAAYERFASAGRITHGEATRKRPLLYHVMSPFEATSHIDKLWPRWAQAPDVGLVVTLYDIIPFRFSTHYLPDAVSLNGYLLRLDMIRRADAVLAISEQTARDAVELLGVSPGRVHNISGACSEFFRPRTSADGGGELARTFPALRPGFLFYTAAIEWRKNLPKLLEAFARLSPELRAAHPLVITCKLPVGGREALSAQARELGIDEHLLLTDYVPDRLLRELYWSCGLFVFPSLYEGFGLPVVEALSCGAPVLVSDRSSLPEIVSDARDRFDPDSPDGIAAAITRALREPGLRDRQLASFRRERFSWKYVATESLKGYEACLARRASRPVRRLARPPRLALFSPMPPLPSELAERSMRLAEALAAHGEVDVVVEGPPSRCARPTNPQVRLISHAGFEWRQHCEPYDKILYCVERSEDHAYMRSFADRYPGEILDHDESSALLNG